MTSTSREAGSLLERQGRDGDDDDDGFLANSSMGIRARGEYVFPAFRGISERSEISDRHSGAGERSEGLPAQTVHHAFEGGESAVTTSIPVTIPSLFATEPIGDDNPARILIWIGGRRRAFGLRQVRALAIAPNRGRWDVAPSTGASTADRVGQLHQRGHHYHDVGPAAAIRSLGAGVDNGGVFFLSIGSRSCACYSAHRSVFERTPSDDRSWCSARPCHRAGRGRGSGPPCRGVADRQW